MSRSEDRDREAVERILGRALDGIWPADAHPAGTRVTVIHDAAWAGPWLNEFSATIDPMGVPEPVKHPHAMPGELKYWILSTNLSMTLRATGHIAKLG